MGNKAVMGENMAVMGKYGCCGENMAIMWKTLRVKSNSISPKMWII